MAPHRSMGFFTSCKHLLTITVQNLLVRVYFCLYSSQTLLLETETQKNLYNNNNNKALLETGSVFRKAVCSDEGTSSVGLLMPQSQDGRRWHFWLLQVTLSTRDRAQNRWAGYFTPDEKLWLISSISDMETCVRTNKLITMKRTWSLIHKYSLVRAFSTFSFTEVHQTNSLLMQTNKGLDSCDLASNNQGNQLILALPFVCGSSMLLPLLYPLGIAFSSFW